MYFIGVGIFCVHNIMLSGIRTVFAAVHFIQIDTLAHNKYAYIASLVEKTKIYKEDNARTQNCTYNNNNYYIKYKFKHYKLPAFGIRSAIYLIIPLFGSFVKCGLSKFDKYVIINMLPTLIRVQRKGGD